MFSKKLYLFTLFLLLFTADKLFACELCTIPSLGKHDGLITESYDKKLFFKYLFEAQDWHEKEAGEAHELHEEGHDFHDKTKEYIHHMTLGHHVTDQLTILLETPYIIRNSIEIEDDSILGTKQKSEGFGDMNLIGLFEIAQTADSSTSLIGGIKFPTGQTKEKNTEGDRFEIELQPGSGSFDYVIGGLYKKALSQSQITTNLAYVFKTEGAQDYRFGDVVSTSLLWEYIIFKKDSTSVFLGLDTNLQHEQKHKNAGEKVDDSGGTTLLMGPTASIDVNSHVSLFSSVHLPVYQDLGGVHQTLDYAWTAGGKISW